MARMYTALTAARHWGGTMSINTFELENMRAACSYNLHFSSQLQTQLLYFCKCWLVAYRVARLLQVFATESFMASSSSTASHKPPSALISTTHTTHSIFLSLHEQLERIQCSVVFKQAGTKYGSGSIMMCRDIVWCALSAAKLSRTVKSM